MATDTPTVGEAAMDIPTEEDQIMDIPTEVMPMATVIITEVWLAMATRTLTP